MWFGLERAQGGPELLQTGVLQGERARGSSATPSGPPINVSQVMKWETSHKWRVGTVRATEHDPIRHWTFAQVEVPRNRWLLPHSPLHRLWQDIVSPCQNSWKPWLYAFLVLACYTHYVDPERYKMNHPSSPNRKFRRGACSLKNTSRARSWECAEHAGSEAQKQISESAVF